ncbi:MAG: NAD-dependent epimerase/dehydratase family protein [Gaiellaceae bacterium]
MKVVVTGSSGKAGRAVVSHLLEQDYDVRAVDLAAPAEPSAPFLFADLVDFGQALECLAGMDAVVHLAAIPASGIHTEQTTFRKNLLSTYNVFEAARIIGLQRIVWASSETILGLPFEREQPAYAPIDEEHPPYPQSSYALSKLLAEELGRQLHRWTGTPHVALRFSNIMEPSDYARFPSFWGDARLRRWNLWGYVDAQDVGASCRLALQADVGAEHFIVAARDTVMTRPSSELMAEVFPSVRYEPTAGEYDTLLSIEKARRLLGYDPQHSWRDHVAA